MSRCVYTLWPAKDILKTWAGLNCETILSHFYTPSVWITNWWSKFIFKNCLSLIKVFFKKIQLIAVHRNPGTREPDSSTRSTRVWTHTHTQFSIPSWDPVDPSIQPTSVYLNPLYRSSSPQIRRSNGAEATHFSIKYCYTARCLFHGTARVRVRVITATWWCMRPSAKRWRSLARYTPRR